ncbi:hypothetical protein K3495_g4114 [Podosphaera aphanis]|nr:hypothetical protein K3495_g4114 [Podosphaera aphanis]
MKLYGFDDQIILSGANLSRDYFTNRQDRYHLFSSKEITTYFFQLHSIISNLSFLLESNSHIRAGYNLKWPTSNLAPSPFDSPSDFISYSSKVLKKLTLSSKNGSSEVSREKITDTIVYPIFQFTPLFCSHTNSSTELPAITSILSILSLPEFKRSSWTFTAGYFNPIPTLTSLLLSTSSTSSNVIIASPGANGFYGSKGISSLLPPAYTLLSRRFVEAINRKGKTKEIEVKEWRRGVNGEPGGWTYHAKGLWISLGLKKSNDGGAEISVVGSSNYTKRSYQLDLEAGAVIITSNEDLKKQLGFERNALSEHARKVSIDDFMKSERKVSFRVRMAMWFVRLVGGAL